MERGVAKREGLLDTSDINVYLYTTNSFRDFLFCLGKLGLNLEQLIGGG